MLAEMFGQTFHTQDIAVVALLIVLEGALSVDNALVLGLLANRLPKHQRRKALTYGLVGAFVFRVLAIAVAAWLLTYPIVKLFGGGYLLYVSLKHFFFDSHSDEKNAVKIGADGHPIIEDEDAGELTPEQREQEIAKRSPVPESIDPSKPADAPPAVLSYQSPTPEITPLGVAKKYAKFWPTVLVIELTDIAFAVDSIVAAMAFIPRHTEAGPNPKLWVVIVGGFFGLVLMRFAAMIFVRLLDRFPRFEVAAYLLVTVIGLKLVVDYIGNRFFATAANPHPVDFHSVSGPWFWSFWVIMVACFAYGFWGRKKTPQAGDVDVTPPSGPQAA